MQRWYYLVNRWKAGSWLTWWPWTRHWRPPSCAATIGWSWSRPTERFPEKDFPPLSASSVASAGLKLFSQRQSSPGLHQLDSRWKKPFLVHSISVHWNFQPHCFMLKQPDDYNTLLHHGLNFAGEQRVFCRPWAPSIFQAGHLGARGLEHQEGGGSKGQPKADDQVLRRPARGVGVGGRRCEGGAGGRWHSVHGGQLPWANGLSDGARRGVWGPRFRWPFHRDDEHTHPGSCNSASRHTDPRRASHPPSHGPDDSSPSQPIHKVHLIC